MSSWWSVVSGVPQGSVLGLLLFLVYINDIDDCLTSNLLKFADDMKLFRAVTSAIDVDNLRNDLRELYGWSDDWLMYFNIDKFKVMHLVKDNPKDKYLIEGGGRY